MGLLGSLGYRARLLGLRRDEYESAELRRWFAEDFGVEVGLYSYGCFDRWRFPARTRIGRYCSFAKTARVVERDHPMEGLTTHPFLYEPALGVAPRPLPEPPWLNISDDVWVSHNATLLPGCRAVGRGAIIGAGAIVTRDVPPYAVMAGAPARCLRMRFEPDMIAALEASRWWEMSKAELAALVARAPETVFRPTVERLAALGRGGAPVIERLPA
jgi:acetyltransferase-like isoleucine patch superfamily enzyme